MRLVCCLSRNDCLAIWLNKYRLAKASNWHQLAYWKKRASWSLCSRCHYLTRDSVVRDIPQVSRCIDKVVGACGMSSASLFHHGVTNQDRRSLLHDTCYSISSSKCIQCWSQVRAKCCCRGFNSWTRFAIKHSRIADVGTAWSAASLSTNLHE